MVRKGGTSRVSSKRPTTSALVGPSLPPIGQPALTYGGSGGSSTGGQSLHNHHVGNGLVSGPGKNAVVVLASSSAATAADDENCPQCGVLFNTSNYRKVTESCGHAKCRRCIIQSEEGCTQCSMGGSSPASAAESGNFVQYHHPQNNRKGPTIVDVTDATGSIGTHHLTRRAAAAHRLQLQSVANSRTNSINSGSGRPTSSSPSSSVSNDTGRQSSSVYSDSADSDSCLRFPSNIGGGVENDGYAATIDFDTMAELTSPTMDTGYMSISDYTSTDNKSYTTIINEDSEFSKSLMSLRKLHEPSIHNNNNNSTSNSTSTTLGTAGQGGLVTRAQLKEMPSLAAVSSGAPTSVSSSPPALNRASSGSSSSLSKRRSKDSSQADNTTNKIASGGGSPDITQGVPRESPRNSTSPRVSSPTVKANSSGGTEEKSGGENSSRVTTSRLSALLTRSSSRHNRGNSSDFSTDPLATTSKNESPEEPPAVHSNSVADKSPSSSSETRDRSSSGSAEIKEEEDSLLNGSGEDSKSGDDDDEDMRQDDADGGGDGPVPKKKKKRSPVVIHDHITVLGGEPPMYQCNVCQKKFKTKAHIKYHEFCQKGDKPFKCEQCGQGFIAKSHYEYHLRTHTGERPYVCPKCGKGFNQRGKVTRHMRSHTGEKPFVCQECNRGFANAQALRSHTLIHTGERPFACTYCNKRFTGMTNLKKHVITHTGERPFSCNHCGKSFGLKWTLDLHLRTHSSERPYACDQCSRAFSNSKDLRRHLVIHSGERPFKCWICGTAFRRKDNLDRHIKNTHNQPKEVAKKLANEAAAEYLKQTTKNQSLGNIPVSKVNSVVISNIIRNNDLMPAGGIVPNNLHNKSRQGAGSSSNANASAKFSPKVSTSGNSGSSTKPSVSASGAATTSPSSVQQSSQSSRRRVIITAPISPPATRASRSKETDSSKNQQRNSTKSLSPSSKKGKGAKIPDAGKGKGASSQSTSQSKKEKMLPPPPPTPLVVPKIEQDSRTIEHKEKKRKSKKKKAKRSKSKKHDRVLSPPSPPITVEITVEHASPSKEKGSRSKDANSRGDAVEAGPLPVDSGKDQRLPRTNYCDDLDNRRPTLTLVTPQSPKKEEDEENRAKFNDRVPTPTLPPPSLELENSGSIQASFAQEVVPESEQDDDRIECILPHDVNQVDSTELMDTLQSERNGPPSTEKESEDLIDIFADNTNASIDSLMQKSEELSPLPAQPPAQLLEDKHEENEMEELSMAVQSIQPLSENDHDQSKMEENDAVPLVPQILPPSFEDKKDNIEEHEDGELVDVSEDEHESKENEEAESHALQTREAREESKENIEIIEKGESVYETLGKDDEEDGELVDVSEDEPESKENEEVDSHALQTNEAREESKENFERIEKGESVDETLGGHGDDDGVLSSASPPIPVESESVTTSKENGSKCEDANSIEDYVEAGPLPVDFGDNQRLPRTSYCEDLCNRRPTLMLVTPQSPKKEEVEENRTKLSDRVPTPPFPPSSLLLENSGSNQASFAHEVVPESEQDGDRIECNLPHNINVVQEAESMDTHQAEANEPPSTEKESDDLMDVFTDKKNSHIESFMQNSEDLSPLPQQPPVHLLEDKLEENEPTEKGSTDLMDIFADKKNSSIDIFIQNSEELSPLSAQPPAQLLEDKHEENEPANKGSENMLDIFADKNTNIDNFMQKSEELSLLPAQPPAQLLEDKHEENEMEGLSMAVQSIQPLSENDHDQSKMEENDAVPQTLPPSREEDKIEEHEHEDGELVDVSEDEHESKENEEAESHALQTNEALEESKANIEKIEKGESVDEALGKDDEEDGELVDVSEDEPESKENEEAEPHPLQTKGAVEESEENIEMIEKGGSVDETLGKDDEEDGELVDVSEDEPESKENEEVDSQALQTNEAREESKENFERIEKGESEDETLGGEGDEDGVLSPALPPIPVESESVTTSKENGSGSENANSREDYVEEESLPVDSGKDQRLPRTSFCDDIYNRRPTLMLVTPQSPKKEEVEENRTKLNDRMPTPPFPSSSLLLENSGSNQDSFAHEVVPESEQDDDRIECNLPHNINVVQEAESMDTHQAEANEPPSTEKESEDLMGVFTDKKNSNIDKFMQKSEELSPLPAQPPAPLLEDKHEENEMEGLSMAVQSIQPLSENDHDQSKVVENDAVPQTLPPSCEDKEDNIEEHEDGELVDVSEDEPESKENEEVNANAFKTKGAVEESEENNEIIEKGESVDETLGDEDDDDDEGRLYVDESYESPEHCESAAASDVEENHVENQEPVVSGNIESLVSEPVVSPRLHVDETEGKPEANLQTQIGSVSVPQPRCESSPSPDLKPESKEESCIVKPIPESEPIPEVNEKQEVPSLPPEISDFVLSVLDNKSDESLGKMDDLESISSASLASPQSDVENSIQKCIQTLESDLEDDNDVDMDAKAPDKENVSTPSLQVPVSSTSSTPSSPTHLLSTSVPKGPILTHPTFSSSASMSSVIPQKKQEPIHRLTFPSLSSQLIKLPAVVPPSVSTVNKTPVVSDVTRLRGIPNPLVRNPPKPQCTTSPVRPHFGSPNNNKTIILVPERSSPPMVPKEEIAPASPPSKSIPVSKSDLPRVGSPKLVLAVDPDKSSSSTQPHPVVTTSANPTPSLVLQGNIQPHANGILPSSAVPMPSPLPPITSIAESVGLGKKGSPSTSGACQSPALPEPSIKRQREENYEAAPTRMQFILPQSVPPVSTVADAPTSSLSVTTTTPMAYDPSLTSQGNIQPRASGMLSSSVVPIPPPLPPITSIGKSVGLGKKGSPSTSGACQSPVLPEPSVKKPREENYEAVPTRIQYILPQSVPPVSTVADASTSSLSVATTSLPTTTPMAYNPSLMSQGNIQPRANGMLPSSVVPMPPAVPNTSNAKAVGPGKKGPSALAAYQCPALPEPSNKRPREEKYEAVTTRLEFLPPQSAPPVSTVAAVSTSSLSVATTSLPTTTPMAYNPSLMSQGNIQPRANGMLPSSVVPIPPPLPPITSIAKSVGLAKKGSPSTSGACQSPVLPEPSNKRPREENYEAVPTRVQFLLPQSVPPVSTVADASTSSLSVATTSQPTTTPMAYDPSLLYFVQPDGQQAFEGNYQLVYAAAAATAERDEGVLDGPPNKVRLLYAEALGVGSDSQNGNELQFYYAATTPDQQVQHTQTPCHVQLMDPCRVTYSQTSNKARSEVLQYQVQSNEQQQQVLNLSVGNNPVYYYNYSSTATLSHPPPPPPPPPPQAGHHQQQQQQQHSTYHRDNGQYCSTSTSTTKLVVANQNAYPDMEASHHQHHNYRQYHDVNSEAQDLSARRLELPVYTASNNQVAYAHVRSNDPVQYNYLEKAREVQHVFPQGAFRHVDSTGYGSLSSMSGQNMTNGMLQSYGKNGPMAATNGGNSGSPGCSSSDPSSSGRKLSGLELLSVATERIKVMQYEALCTERAAAAIAAVGELARLKRMETHQQAPPQHPPPRQEQQPPPPQPSAPVHQSQSFSHTVPQKSQGNMVPTTSHDQHPNHFDNVGPQQRVNNHQYPPQHNMQAYQGHPHHTVQPSPPEIPMGTNPEDQQAGIRRGPRKYYLSRSAQFQD